MAKTKYCPICDQPVKGRFCTNCKEFVTPYEHDMDYHMNASHDPKNDPNCEYHGTATTQTTNATAKPVNDRERMEQARKSFESHGAARSTGTGSSGNKKSSSGVMITIWVALIFIAIGVIVGVISGMNAADDDSDREVEVESTDGKMDIADEKDPDDDDDDNMAFPFTQPTAEGMLSDEEYEKLLEENGFDEEGYKDVDYDEVLAAGEPCDGWEHFENLTSRTASRHIRTALEEAGIACSNYDAGVNMDNYYYMNQYGEVKSYFQTYLYVTLDDDSYESGYSGFLYLVSDSVTDELMAVCVKEDDLEVFKSACEAIMMELDEDHYFDITTKFKVDINRALKDDDGYEYLEYGNLWFDLTYYDEVQEDAYQYTGWIYLADPEEEE